LLQFIFLNGHSLILIPIYDVNIKFVYTDTLQQIRNFINMLLYLHRYNCIIGK